MAKQGIQINSQSFQQGVNRVGISYSRPGTRCSDNKFRGSLQPQAWRTSYDTKEIGHIISPPATAHQATRGTDRYETSNMLEFKDRSALVIREFGNDEMRKLRHVIETTDPNMINQDERYLNIMSKMAKQREINNSQP